ncbi:hypothetical protein BH02_5852 [Burkholderia pseudomallei]|nr:hypothetical protein BH02_5852 [Burkholderia pseudomallei]
MRAAVARPSTPLSRTPACPRAARVRAATCRLRSDRIIGQPPRSHAKGHVPPGIAIPVPSSKCRTPNERMRAAVARPSTPLSRTPACPRAARVRAATCRLRSDRIIGQPPRSHAKGHVPPGIAIPVPSSKCRTPNERMRAAIARPSPPLSRTPACPRAARVRAAMRRLRSDRITRRPRQGKSKGPLPPSVAIAQSGPVIDASDTARTCSRAGRPASRRRSRAAISAASAASTAPARKPPL